MKENVFSLIMGTYEECCVSQMVLVVKKLPANTGDIRKAGWIPELGRSPGGGPGNPLKCSSLENPMDRRAWWATVQCLGSQRVGRD